jgi:GNAT superfamily N-acetyltransferase
MLSPADSSLALAYVEAYFEHDGLEFSGLVLQGVHMLLANPEFGRFYEIFREGQGVGYVVLTFGFDHEFGGRIGMITDLFLLPESRGKGLGSEVIRLVQESARSTGVFVLELVVLKHNSRARTFYERNGFFPLEDRTTMLKPLGQP